MQEDWSTGAHGKTTLFTSPLHAVKILACDLASGIYMCKETTWKSAIGFSRDSLNPPSGPISAEQRVPCTPAMPAMKLFGIIATGALVVLPVLAAPPFSAQADSDSLAAANGTTIDKRTWCPLGG